MQIEEPWFMNSEAALITIIINIEQLHIPHLQYIYEEKKKYLDGDDSQNQDIDQSLEPEYGVSYKTPFTLIIHMIRMNIHPRDSTTSYSSWEICIIVMSIYGNIDITTCRSRRIPRTS